MYTPESEFNNPRVSDVRKTERGLQCDLTYQGNKYSIIAASASGDPIITAGTTQGLIKFEELPPDVKRLVAKRFEELEQAYN